jgi:hypothetical protein
MRYDNVETKKLDDGRTVLKTKIFPPIPKRDDDIYILTQETDRLDTLANYFYGDSTLWWIIVHANNLSVADIGVEPGIQLRIPKDEFIVKDLINSNI